MCVQGIDVPNLDERRKVSLFADDMTVILTEHDSFTELTKTPSEGCKVSGAKFNVEKTEIIPIGTAEYYKKLVETRKLGNASEVIPASVHIKWDGDAIRLLGAWIGDDVNPESHGGRFGNDKKRFQQVGDKIPHPGG